MNTVANKTQPNRPSAAEVRKYLSYWQTLENYARQNDALQKLMGLLPENKELSDVLLKASAINDFYSTNIFAIYPVARHILSIKDIDKRLTSGDLSLVAELAMVDINGKARNFYSFATKYCSHHNPKAFPIYDSYVVNLLWFFKKEYQFSSFKKADLKNYETFNKVLCDFQKYFELTEYDLRQIDSYLWLQGKEYLQNA